MDKPKLNLENYPVKDYSSLVATRDDLKAKNSGVIYQMLNKIPSRKTP